jgi:hypothetical protein
MRFRELREQEFEQGSQTTLSLVVSRCAQTQRSPSRVVNGPARYRDEGVAMSAAETKSLPSYSRALHESHHRHHPAHIRHGVMF